MREKRGKAKFIFSFILVLAVAALVGCANSAEGAGNKHDSGTVLAKAGKEKPAQKQQAPDPAQELDVLVLGMNAPDFNLEDADGRAYELDDFKGRTVIIAFWDASCPKELCADQIKLVEDSVAKQKLDAAVLPVTRYVSKDKNKSAADDLKKKGVKSPSMFDVNNATARAYELKMFPSYVLIGPDGRLRASGPFMVDQKFQTMDFLAMIAAAAKGKDVPRCEFAHYTVSDDQKKWIGKDPPNFKENDLDGTEQSPLFYKGFSRLLIVFWSPSCPHCRAELPRLEYFNRTKAAKLGVKIVSVVALPEQSDKDFAQVLAVTKQVILQLKVTFPVVPDYGLKIQNSFSVRGVPSLFLLGADGKVEHAWQGESEFIGEDVECVLDKLDSGKKR
jgi:peroxiredoxin